MKLTIRTAQDVAARTVAQDRQIAQRAARTCLDRTDWLIMRQAETGKPVPQTILDQRAAARACLDG